MSYQMEVLQDAIDLHVHSAPDLFPRLLNHYEVAKDASNSGMRGVVLKCHFSTTSFRAQLVNEIMGEKVLYGSVTLNEYVGGFNASAVEAAIKAQAKIVWMPTINSQNHLNLYGSPTYAAQDFGETKTKIKGLSIFDDESEMRSDVREVLKVVADYGVTLATAHLSPEEIKILVREALEMGIKNIIVTHVEDPLINLSIEDQKELVQLGNVYVEHTVLSTMPAWYGIKPKTIVSMIKGVGPENCIMASDLGQVHNPPPAEGLRMFVMMLKKEKISDNDIDTMLRENPRKLLK